MMYVELSDQLLPDGEGRRVMTGAEAARDDVDAWEWLNVGKREGSHAITVIA